MARRKPADSPQPTKVLRAAATRIRVDTRGRSNKSANEPWQRDAWDVYDMVGEVKQATTFLANVVSNVRLFIGVRTDDPEQEPIPATTEPGAAEAIAVLDRLRRGSVYGGLGGLLAESVTNLKVAGEYYLLGEPEVLPDSAGRTVEVRMGKPERWDVMSIDEIEVKDRGEVLIHERPGDAGRKVHLPPAAVDDPVTNQTIAQDDPEAVFMLRVWQRHPRFSDLADSALRAVLTECDSLLILSRGIRGAARSRLAGNGIAVIANEYSTAVPPEEGDAAEDPEADPFMRQLARAMIEPITDETNPDGLVPIVLRADAEVIEKAPIQHITFSKASDAAADSATREELIGRLGHSLDIPVEQLTGLAKVNHWTAWQIDVASWSRYGKPVTQLVVDSWTEGLLWPFLDEAGVDAAAAAKLCIWFDPADAIVDPDQGATADSLFDHGSISWEAHRTRLGAGDDEAPSEEELQHRADLGLFKGGGASASSGVGPPAGAGPNSAGRTTGNVPVQIVAAARSSLGRRLMRLDRTLRTRLAEAADSALRSVLTRAGARVRTAAQRNANVTAAVDGVANHLVAARVGPAVVASLGLTDDGLIDGELEGLHERFNDRVDAAQARTRAMLADEYDLDDEELAALEQQQARGRDEAWLWLAGAMTTLARNRLYDPTGELPAAGEFDASATVPTGMLREAMARAGGGMPAAGQPLGGVATGVDVMALWARHGQVVGGWEWVYGDPSSRTSPFEPHEGLDGQQFDTWEDPVLANTEGWPDGDFYRPGDHDWCQCDFVPIPVDGAGDRVPAEAVA